MSRRRFWTVIGATLVALGGLIAVTVVLLPQGDDDGLPSPLESVFPLPGDAVVRQTVIEVDLPVGYVLDLEVDGMPIPPTEVGFTSATGVWVWQPAPGGIIEQWEPGDHRVIARWDRTGGAGPDPGEFGWTFRVA